jgi:GTP-binding protein
MRREGFEFLVSRPEVIYKRIADVLSEPVEHVIIDVPDEFVGTVIENLGRRRGGMKNMISSNGNTRLEFFVPSRGLIGFRGEFLTQTKGNRHTSPQLPWLRTAQRRTCPQNARCPRRYGER